jgi:polyribonucleotide nucleotidyltransferase
LNVPFQGPIAGVNVGYVDGKYVINPTVEEKEVSRLDLEVIAAISGEQSGSALSTVFII